MILQVLGLSWVFLATVNLCWHHQMQIWGITRALYKMNRIWSIIIVYLGLPFCDMYTEIWLKIGKVDFEMCDSFVIFKLESNIFTRSIWRQHKASVIVLFYILALNLMIIPTLQGWVPVNWACWCLHYFAVSCTCQCIRAVVRRKVRVDYWFILLCLGS